MKQAGLRVQPRDTVSVQPVGDLLWEGTVRYGTVPQTSESVFSFDTGGGTQHITQSLANVARYAPPGKTAPDFNCGTGFQPVILLAAPAGCRCHNADSVEGVDITGGAGVPARESCMCRGQDARATLAETHYLDNLLVTPAYKLTLFALTGRVNSSAFKGFTAGECLLMSASRSRAITRAGDPSACSQIRRTNHPALVIFALAARSRATFLAIFFFQ